MESIVTRITSALETQETFPAALAEKTAEDIENLQQELEGSYAAITQEYSVRAHVSSLVAISNFAGLLSAWQDFQHRYPYVVRKLNL